MNSMNKLIIKVTAITALIFQYSLNASEKLNETYVMGFGSCITEKREQPIWNAIEKENIDEFFFMGDNVYGDSEDGPSVSSLGLGAGYAVMLSDNISPTLTFG